MIPTFLQDTLVSEFKEVLSIYKLKNTLGEMVSLNVYPQFLPAKKEDDDVDHFPYVIISLQDGEDPSEMDSATCKIIFVIGCYDDADNYQGFKDVLNVIDKINEHLMKKRVFENQYRVVHPISWSINEEDTYPFYFGGLETNWEIAKITQMEDEHV